MALADPTLIKYGPITWDTRFAKLTADEVNAISNHVNNVLPGLYAPGAGQTFADVYMQHDTIVGGTVQTLPFASFVTLNLNKERTDAAGAFNSSSGQHIYYCPVAGFYAIQALVRLQDAAITNAQGANVGIGVDTVNGDGPWFHWNKVPATNIGAARAMLAYQRTAYFAQNAPLRLYAFYDSAVGSGSLAIMTAQMQVWRIG
jgi:hypothetical protein